MGWSRAVAPVAVLLVVVGVGCDGVDAPPLDSVLDGGPTGPATATGPRAEPTGGASGPGWQTGPAGSAAPDPGREQPAGPSTDDHGPVGANGPAILAAGMPRLVVEIDRQEGARLPPAAVDHLMATLRRHADKPGGIARAGGSTFASDRTRWSAAQIRRTAAANRDVRSGPDRVAIYLLALRGEMTRDGQTSDAIGVAVNASEVGLFPERWAGLADLLGGSEAVGRAVLVHELGHLLGLVNLTYEARHGREDPEHPGHSASRDSVMYWAIETTLIGQVFSGPPPDRFDAADRDDIAFIRRRGEQR